MKGFFFIQFFSYDALTLSHLLCVEEVKCITSFQQTLHKKNEREKFFCDRSYIEWHLLLQSWVVELIKIWKKKKS